MTSVFSVIAQGCRREFLRMQRQPKHLAMTSLYLALLLMFFPMTVLQSGDSLQGLFPGLLWFGLLLGAMSASDGFFAQDKEDGVLEQWALRPGFLPALVFSKILTQWACQLGLVLLWLPLAAVLYNLSGYALGVSMLALLLGSLGMWFLTGLAAAFLSVSAQKGAMMALVLLPLCLPWLIFGSGCLRIAYAGGEALAYLALLLAFSLAAMVLIPFAIAAILTAQAGS